MSVGETYVHVESDVVVIWVEDGSAEWHDCCCGVREEFRWFGGYVQETR